MLLAEPTERGWIIYMGAWVDAKKIWIEGLGLRSWPSGWTAACVVIGDRQTSDENRYYWRPKQAIVIPSHWMPIVAPAMYPSRAMDAAWKEYDRNPFRFPS